MGRALTNSMFVLKLALVPSLVALITLAGRRWGPGLAGWMAALPVMAGPVLGFLCAEQGPTFAQHAAQGTLSGVLAMMGFVISYAWWCRRWPWHLCWPMALGVYGLIAWGLQAMPPPWPVSLALNALVLTAAPRLMPQADAHELARPSPVASRSSTWLTLAARMVAGGLLVWLVTHLADQLGERLSGILAVFPVMVSVLAVFTHHQQGPAHVVALLRGTVRGWWGFSLFCLVLILALDQWAPWRVFGLALLAALVMAAGLRWHDHRPRPAA